MRRIILSLCFISAVFLVGQDALFASSVSVGDKSVKIVDAFARLENFFGKPTLEVFFFSAPVKDEQKERIALIKGPLDKDFEEIAEGNLPVFQLLFYFKEGTRICSGDSLVSYTAVFNKNKSFDFGTAKDIPINWAFQGPSQNTLQEIGIQNLSCSFQQGGVVDITVEHQWNAKKPDFAMIIPAGQDSLQFTWDIDASIKLMDPLKAISTQPLVEINNAMIKDKSVYWVPKNNLLRLRFYKREISPDEKKAVAKNPFAVSFDDTLCFVEIKYNNLPATFSSEEPEWISFSFYEKKTESYMGHSYIYEKGTGIFEINGVPRLGTDILLRFKADGAPDPREQKPAMSWNIDITAPIEEELPS